MKSDVVRLYGPRDLKIEQEELPELNEGEILCETTITAISPGTEVSAYVGDPPLRPGKFYPRVNGYCSVAKVLESKDSSVKKGDILYTHASHRTTFICKSDEILMKVPDTISHESAATLYLYHLGYYSLKRCNVTDKSRIAVIGLGCLGMSACLIADAMGYDVTGFSNREDSLSLLKKKGIACDKKTTGKEFDVVLLTSNSWDDWKLAIQIAAADGSISILGFPGRGFGNPDFNPLDPQYLYMKRLTIIQMGNPPWDEILTNLQKIKSLVEDKKLDTNDIISSRVPFKDIENAYEAYAKREQTLYTTILEF